MNYPNYPTYFGGQNQAGQQFQPVGGIPPRPEMTYQQPQIMQPAQMQIANQQTTPQQLFSPASRIVSSREEALAVAADFSGATEIFYDAAHDCVYIKQWDNPSGSAIFRDYPRAVPSTVQNQDQRQAQGDKTILELAQDIQDLYEVSENLMKEVDQLKKSTGKAGKRNESDDE